MHEIIAKSLISSNNTINLYRGCLHGCIYCDARATQYNMNHAFEDIGIKVNCLELLEETLKRKRNKCMIHMGAMSDPYNPLELKYEYTRKSLEIIRNNHFGVSLITKSNRVLRDLDLLKQINEDSKAIVEVTLTTSDENIRKVIEPHSSSTRDRIEILKIMQQHHIPTIVWLMPILPYINDTKENILSIIEACHQYGVKGIICFNMGLTLKDGNREYFYKKLKEYDLNLYHLYQRQYGNSYSLVSPHNNELMTLFHKTCEQYGIMHNPEEIFKYRDTYEEPTLFSF